MLAKGESIDNFREVTATEKATLEASDAAWVEPPQSFVDKWNKACVVTDPNFSWSKSVGRYNADSGFFELNGLKDITHEQALCIMAAHIGEKNLTGCRTNLPPNRSQKVTEMMTNTTTIMEVFWGNALSKTPVFDNVQNSCVREYRYITISSFINYQFQHNSQLETIRDITITAKGTMVLSGCPKLTLETIQNLVAANPSGNTIHVAATIYAKLTDEENAEWHQVLLDADAKNITFITA